MPDVTPYHLIAELVQWIREAPDRREEALAHLATLEADLESWHEKAHRLVAQDDSGRSLLESSRQGIDMFREAGTLVREYAAHRDEARAEEALERAREGVEMILRAKLETEERLEARAKGQ